MNCTEPGDYSVLSPIESSSQGGAEIARSMVRSVLGHDFTVPGCRIYPQSAAPVIPLQAPSRGTTATSNVLPS